jgi:uncharacterized BrkB/YihY/UPF0761 family membrane protein
MPGRTQAGLRALQPWSQRHRSARVARGTISSFLEHEALQYAGSMAYFGVLSMFQLLVLGVVVLSVVVDEGQARTTVIDQVRTATPLDAATTGSVIDGVIKACGDMTVVGLAFLVWGALGVFAAVSSGIGRAFWELCSSMPASSSVERRRTRTNRTYVLARPTGLGRADDIYIRMPIEGREDWIRTSSESA